MSHPELNDLKRNLETLNRHTAGIPVRYGSSRNTTVPTQVAMVVGTSAVSGATSPHYSDPYDLTFHIPHDISAAVLVVNVVLLTSNADGSGGYFIDNEDDGTLDDLTISALDVRREGKPKLGDLVYIWTSDGTAVVAGEDGWSSGTWTGGHGIYTAPVNATDYLRALDTYDTTQPQIPFHDAGDDTIQWVTPDDFSDGPFGGGGGGGIAGMIEGYAIDLEGSGTVTVHNNPTEWTGFAKTGFQVMVHDIIPGTPARTDPKWTTITSYDATKNQIWFVKSGTIKAQTTTGYDATKIQQLVNLTDAWEWDEAGMVRSTSVDSTLNLLHDALADKTAAGTYVSGQDAIVKNETVGAANTDQTERVFVDVSIISGWSGAVTQVLTHDGSGNLKWGDSTDPSFGLRWGKITTQASPSTTAGTATNDGRCTLFAAFGGTTGTVLNNLYPDTAPVNAIVCIDGSNRIVQWSCGTL